MNRDEDPAVGGEDPSEVGVVLQRRHESIGRERSDPGADRDQPAVLSSPPATPARHRQSRRSTNNANGFITDTPQPHDTAHHAVGHRRRAGCTNRYRNPIGFVELQDVHERWNFFERTVSAHQVGTIGDVAFDAF